MSCVDEDCAPKLVLVKRISFEKDVMNTLCFPANTILTVFSLYKILRMSHQVPANSIDAFSHLQNPTAVSIQKSTSLTFAESVASKP